MRTFVNKPGVLFDPLKTTVVFAEDLNEMWAAILLGGGGAVIENPIGAVDSLNTVFEVSEQPSRIVVDGLIYFEGAGYSYLAPNITTDIPPSSFIRAMV